MLAQGMLVQGMFWASWQASLIQVRNLAAPSARALQNHSPRRERAQGMPGARCTRGLVCKMCEENAHEHTGTDGAIRHSLRNGFTAYAALSPVTSSFLSPSPRELEGSSAPGRVDTAFARLSTSNGRQDHTVLPYAASPVVRTLCSLRPTITTTRPTLPASTASRPNVRDDGQRPSCRTR